MGPTKLLLASAELGEYNKRFDKALCYQVFNRVDRASATETADWGSISGRVKLMTIKKLVFTASLLDVQQLKRQCPSTVCGRQVAA